jgi:hypothetical protein
VASSTLSIVAPPGPWRRLMDDQEGPRMAPTKRN